MLHAREGLCSLILCVYIMWLLFWNVAGCIRLCLPHFMCSGLYIYVVVTPHVPPHTYIYTILFFPLHPVFMCAQVVMCCESVPIVQCREDAMPFTYVLRVAILLWLSTLPPRWRTTSLTLMMLGTQHCTGQPKRVSCLWWSTSSNPADLMWKQGTRLAYIVCCLSDAFLTSLDTPAARPQKTNMCARDNPSTHLCQSKL